MVIAGPMYSAASLMVAPMMSLYQIPTLGMYATVDELSDKTKYEYFIRLIPPTRFQVRAIVDFLARYNFSYISIIHSDGTWGENNAKYLHQQAKERGMCIAVSERLVDDTDEESYDSLARKLIKNKNARVIVLFISGNTKTLGMFEVMKQKEVYNYFIWIAVHVWTRDSLISMNNYEQIANGYVYLRFKRGNIYKPFDDYYKYLTPENVTGNPWFKPLWEEYYGCQWDNPEIDCNVYADKPYTDYKVTVSTNRYYDGAYVYALALDRMIRTKCPEAFMDQSLLVRCVDRKELLSSMKNISFTGLSGHIKFNDDGDMLAQYIFYQYITQNNSHFHNVIGTWNQDTNNLELNEDIVDWSMLRDNENNYKAIDNTPESVCSKPCANKQFAIQQEVYYYLFLQYPVCINNHSKTVSKLHIYHKALMLVTL